MSEVKEKNSLSLYGITQEIDALDELLELDGGEVTDDHEKLEEQVMVMLQSKVDSCVGYIEREKDLINLAKEKAKELKAFADSKQKKIDRFDSYVQECLLRSGKQSLKGSLNQIKLRKPSQVLVIDDEKEVPMEFTKVETTVKIDKAGLKKAVKAGEVKSDSIRLVDGKISVIYGLSKGK